MTSYIFLFTFAMVLLLTNAKPVFKALSGMTDDNNMIDYDTNNGRNKFVENWIHEQESKERQPRESHKLPNMFVWEYQQRTFRQ
jgi:hypothetical protein